MVERLPKDPLITPELIADHGLTPDEYERLKGILKRERTILGMMPHPERAAEPGLGSSDGQKIIVSLLKNIAK